MFPTPVHAESTHTHSKQSAKLQSPAGIWNSDCEYFQASELFPLKSLDAVHGYQDMWHSASSDSARNSWEHFETIAFSPLTKDAVQADQGVSEAEGCSSETNA